MVGNILEEVARESREGMSLLRRYRQEVALLVSSQRSFAASLRRAYHVDQSTLPLDVFACEPK